MKEGDHLKDANLDDRMTLKCTLKTGLDGL